MLCFDYFIIMTIFLLMTSSSKVFHFFIISLFLTIGILLSSIVFDPGLVLCTNLVTESSSNSSLFYSILVTVMLYIIQPVSHLLKFQVTNFNHAFYILLPVSHLLKFQSIFAYLDSIINYMM